MLDRGQDRRGVVLGVVDDEVALQTLLVDMLDTEFNVLSALTRVFLGLDVRAHPSPIAHRHRAPRVALFGPQPA